MGAVAVGLVLRLATPAVEASPIAIGNDASALLKATNDPPSASVVMVSMCSGNGGAVDDVWSSFLDFNVELAGPVDPISHLCLLAGSDLPERHRLPSDPSPDERLRSINAPSVNSAGAGRQAMEIDNFAAQVFVSAVLIRTRPLSRFTYRLARG